MIAQDTIKSQSPKKILLTGATGYIAKRLLPMLLEAGHEVTCCVRDKSRFPLKAGSGVKVLEIDFLQEPDLKNLPGGFDAAYYLIHSMAVSQHNFMKLESRCAENFRTYMEHIQVDHVLYLSGIAHEENELSVHLLSRKKVEHILRAGSYNTTTVRAGIIVGSGSASFEIIRDIVEKLPFLITPKWVLTRSQPVAIRDVVTVLLNLLSLPQWQGKGLDIGGPDVLTYREMILRFAKIRGLKRYMVTVPLMSPRLSSYWLYFVTSVSYNLATSLVDSMKVEVMPKNNALPAILGREPIPYEDAVRLAFKKIEQNSVVSSWKDAMTDKDLKRGKLNDFIQVPQNGCLKDVREMTFAQNRASGVLSRVFAIGGDTGWYYGTWLWKIRGWMDKAVGGIGLRRGRTDPIDLNPGDALDFWRVLLADKEEQRLLLFAEMRLPGEAWLEFRIDHQDSDQARIIQTATFRPRGLWGRLYWYSVMPLHFFVFRGMLRRIVEG